MFFVQIWRRTRYIPKNRYLNCLSVINANHKKGHSLGTRKASEIIGFCANVIRDMRELNGKLRLPKRECHVNRVSVHFNLEDRDAEAVSNSTPLVASCPGPRAPLWPSSSKSVTQLSRLFLSFCHSPEWLPTWQTLPHPSHVFITFCPWRSGNRLVFRQSSVPALKHKMRGILDDEHTSGIIVIVVIKEMKTALIRESSWFYVSVSIWQRVALTKSISPSSSPFTSARIPS